jgi:hypothetical protein
MMYTDAQLAIRASTPTSESGPLSTPDFIAIRTF